MKFSYSAILVIFFISIFNYSNAQRSGGDYIAIDTLLITGKVTPLGKGKVKFKRNKRADAVIYNLSEIKEYSYDRKVYEALPIFEDQRFIRRLVTGRANLYKHENKYVLKIDSNLTLFSRDSYRVVFNKLINCEGSDVALSRLAYTKPALKNYVNSFNIHQCNTDNLPYDKFGGYFGINLLRFSASFGTSMQLRDGISAPTGGLFWDHAIYRPRQLFLSTELNWLHAKPLLYTENQSSTNFSGMVINGVNALIGAKWLFDKDNMRPYIKGGPQISMLTYTSPTGLVETIRNGPAVDTKRENISNSSTFLCGFHAGVGLELPYRQRKNFHLELKYSIAVSVGQDPLGLRYSGLSIIAGFNI